MIGATRLPDFMLIAYNTSQTRTDYTAGNWDQLYSKFIFKRQRGYYILQVFFLYLIHSHTSDLVPGVFANVLVSVHFMDRFLDRHESVASAHYTGCELSHGAYIPIRQHCQKSTQGLLCESKALEIAYRSKSLYTQALDIWMFGCVGFIFLSLVELAVVGFADKLDNRRRHAAEKLALQKKSSVAPPMSMLKTDSVEADPRARMYQVP